MPEPEGGGLGRLRLTAQAEIATCYARPANRATAANSALAGLVSSSTTVK